MAKTAFLYPRVELLRNPRNIRLGAEVVVKSGAQLCPCNASASISVGDRTTIGFYTFIYASSEIFIGADCMIAPFAYLVDSNHGTRREVRMNLQSNQSKPIHIEDDAWIGAHAVILPGVTVANGAVVAAGAVVTRSVEAFSIVGGVPARPIGARE